MRMGKDKRRIKHLVSLVLFISGFVAFHVPSFPQNPSGYLRSGQNYLRNGQFVEALKSLNTAILEFPATSELYYLRGFAKYSLDDYLGAEVDYTKSLDLFPFEPNVLLNRAEVRSQQGNLSGALEDLLSARSLDSTNPEIFFSLAKAKLSLKKYYACISDCKDAIRLGYKSENIYLLKGGAESGLKRYELAIIDYNKAVVINPENPYGYIQLGAVWMNWINLILLSLTSTKQCRLIRIMSMLFSTGRLHVLRKEISVAHWKTSTRWSVCRHITHMAIITAPLC
jgi:tetratricopeptide (TPR) repeat protein